LSNDAAFEMFFQQLDQVQEQKTVQEELRRGNELFASKRLATLYELQPQQYPLTMGFLLQRKIWLSKMNWRSCNKKYQRWMLSGKRYGNNSRRMINVSKLLSM
jgi:hypothetical protein